MKKDNMELVDAAEVPGVVIMDGVPCGEVGGRWCPVVGVLRRGGGYIPVLDIPQMNEVPTARKAAV